MNLKLQKELAARVFGVGKGRVKVDPKASDTIKDAITKADIRSLVESGEIKILQLNRISRHRARDRKEKRKKGRARGHGRRKGRATARTPSKMTWINKVRLQRRILASLKTEGKLTTINNRTLYRKIKGGFFRSKKHLVQYIDQNKLMGVKK